MGLYWEGGLHARAPIQSEMLIPRTAPFKVLTWPKEPVNLFIFVLSLHGCHSFERRRSRHLLHKVPSLFQEISMEGAAYC